MNVIISYMSDAPKFTEGSLPVLQKGHYEMVDLIAGRVKDICKDDLGLAGQVKQTASRLPGLLKGFQFGRSAAVDEVTEAFERAHYVLDHHAIGEGEVTVLRKYINNDMPLANALGMIIRRYQEALKPGDAYGLGIILADFYQVIGPELAGAFLRATLDPNISQSIAEGKGLRSLGPQETKQPVQVLPHSVEAFVLLQPEVRNEILKAMVKAGGNSKEQARRLYQNISTNINSKGSVYFAQYHIFRNLVGTMATSQINQVTQDMTVWRDITR